MALSKDQELELLLLEKERRRRIPQENGKSLSGLLDNTGESIKKLGPMVLEMAKNNPAVRLPKYAMGQGSLTEDAKKDWETLKGIPGGLKDRAVELGLGELATGHPVKAFDKASDAFYEDPIFTALDLASLVDPALGAGKFAARKVPALMEDAAVGLARRGAGFSKGMLNKPGALARANDATRIGLEEGVFSKLPHRNTPEQMFERAGDLKASAGQKYGDIGREIEAAGELKLDPLRAADPLDASFQDYGSFKSSKSLGSQYDNAVDDILGLGDNPQLSKFEKLKKVFSDLGYKKGNPVESKFPAQEAFGSMSDELERAIGEGAENLNRPELINEFSKAKRQYGGAKQLSEGLLMRNAGAAGNNMITPTGKAVGLSDFIRGGDPLTSLAMTGATDAIKSFGPATMGANLYGAAKALKSIPDFVEKLSKAMQINPSLLGKFQAPMAEALQRGAQSVAATHFILSSNPEYQKMIENIDDQKDEDNQ